MSVMPLELTVIVPTFKETGNIVPLVERLDQALAGIAWEVVFVDDDSPDGTADTVRALAQCDRRVRVIQRIGRRGLASACVEGILSSSAPYAAVMDADLQHDETLLPQMLQRLKDGGLDLVVASRYVEGGSVACFASHRLAISRLRGTACASPGRRHVAGPDERILHRAALGLRWQRSAALAAGLQDPVRPHGILTASAYIRGVALSLRRTSTRPEQVRCTRRLAVRRDHPPEACWPLCAGTVRVVCAGWGTGILVHLAALYVLLRAHASFGAAQSGAVLVAMTSNFMLNNLITYRDRSLKGTAFVRGLLSFYAVCAIGAVANVGIAGWVYSEQPIWWVAGLAGAAISSVWNYAVSRLYTWRETDFA